jgi:hypothetical protein
MRLLSCRDFSANGANKALVDMTEQVVKREPLQPAMHPV